MSRAWIAALVLLAIAVAVDVARGVPYLFPGFWAAFGLAGAALLIGLAKGVLKGLIQRPEDHYEALRRD